MIVLVRVLSPQDYGLVAACSGILGAFTALGCQGFLNHALQTTTASGPDWDAHWGACLRMQSLLYLVLNAVAGCMWLVPAYRELAPLLHVSSIALLLSLPHLLAAKMMEYRMEFRRMQAFSVGTLVLANGVALTLAPWLGAYGAIVGNAIVNLLPLTVYLVFTLKWRPRLGWWGAVDWVAYASALKFGVNFNMGSLIMGARGWLEGAVLPATVGMAGLGLVNRGQALFQATMGRVGMMVMDGVYPVLPRLAGEPTTFPGHIRTVLELGLLGALGGGTFLAMEAVRMSRLLYGARWTEADPLLVAGTVVGMSGMLQAMARVLLLTTERLRECSRLNWAVGTSSLLPVGLSFLWPAPENYMWLLACTQVAAAAVGLWQLRALLAVPLWRVFTPALTSAAAGAAIWMALDSILPARHAVAHLLIGAAVFGLGMLTVLRLVFPGRVRALLGIIPQGQVLLRWGRLA